MKAHKHLKIRERILKKLTRVLYTLSIVAKHCQMMKSISFYLFFRLLIVEC